MAVQVNGKTRGQVTVRRGATEQEVVAVASAQAPVARHLAGKQPKRVVFVPDRLINLLTEDVI